jgi:hypothetical protein
MVWTDCRNCFDGYNSWLFTAKGLYPCKIGVSADFRFMFSCLFQRLGCFRIQRLSVDTNLLSYLSVFCFAAGDTCFAPGYLFGMFALLAATLALQGLLQYAGVLHGANSFNYKHASRGGNVFPIQTVLRIRVLHREKDLNNDMTDF